jgi:hypothetical protein
VMLPEIFRTDDPVLALRLPLEIRQQLQALVAGLESEVFTASDSLGWTYQFWQTKRKKEVNDSGVKIGADELSPVTQLFTEDYMVDFLLDNTLGAWHAGMVLAANTQLATTAQSEEELRQAVSLPDCPWNYLRFIKTEDGGWTPAAGVFEGWPKTAAELRCLDPCMGSGHFVVAMFERLVTLRKAEEGGTEKAAVAAVIRDNLFGLEIDPRCTQIAAFNLALAAWRRVGHCKLPAMNLACSGLAPNTPEAEWVASAGENERLRNGMAQLYALFKQATVLGSLINPSAGDADLLVAEFAELQPLLEKAFAKEVKDDMNAELAVTAQGIAKAADVLAGKFTLVATNVPYLGRQKQADELQSYCDVRHAEAKFDIATCFVERCLDFCSRGGSTALVTPQNWLQLGAYTSLRERLLVSVEWNAVARLGSRAFATIGGEIVNVALIVFSRRLPSGQHRFLGIDATAGVSADAKASSISGLSCLDVAQAGQAKNPDARLTLTESDPTALLSRFAETFEGLTTGDLDRFVERFWEQASVSNGWEPFIGNVREHVAYGGREQILLWENGRGALANSPSGYIKGYKAWGKTGLRISQTGTMIPTIYTGELFDKNAATLIPFNREDLLPIYCYAQESEYTSEVRNVDQGLKVTIGTLVKIPFDLVRWQTVAAEKYPHGLPKAFSSDPTQWLFSGYPAGAGHPLHVAVPRLVGYQWPRQTGSSFPDCPALEPDGLGSLADDDGIVCLSPARGEAAAADRLRILLAAAFGEEWSSAKERELLLETAVAFDAKKAAADIGDWLRQNFFAEHCKLFQSRPFIWQIWDGNPNGFSALVNYHKLAAPKGQGRKTLELLTYTYLGDWIDRQKLDQAEGINGADDRLAAALDLQGQLKKILDGEPPYDIFVRWKPLHQQAIGWDPNINDGVRLNIRPFLNAQLRKGGKAGAGILRAKPGTIKWAKDRGKEPMRAKDEFPWFWGWDETNHALAQDFGASIPGAPPASESFDGNRWNDLHYSRAAKEAARAKQRGEA